MKRLDSHKHNVLLLKDDVGRPKPSTRRLPGGPNFSFGKAERKDAEGARQGKSRAANVATFDINLLSLIVTSKWQYSRETELQRQDKDFKRLNKSAIGQRATTADVSDLDSAPF